MNAVKERSMVSVIPAKDLSARDALKTYGFGSGGRPPSRPISGRGMDDEENPFGNLTQKDHDALLRNYYTGQLAIEDRDALVIVIKGEQEGYFEPLLVRIPRDNENWN